MLDAKAVDVLRFVIFGFHVNGDDEKLMITMIMITMVMIRMVMMMMMMMMMIL